MLFVYDIASRASFAALSDFLADVRALTSPSVSIVVLGNKTDLAENSDPTQLVPEHEVAEFCMANSTGNFSSSSYSKNSVSSISAFQGSDISFLTTSALTGENIAEAFEILAGMILTKVEMGVVDPENIDSGVQYGDVPRWDGSTRRNYGVGGSSSKAKRHGRSLTTLVAGSGHLGAGGGEFQSRLQKNRIVLGRRNGDNPVSLDQPQNSASGHAHGSRNMSDRCC